MSSKETAKRSAIKDAEGRSHPSLSEIRNLSGLLGVFGLGFDIGWDACSRHEGSQKVTATHGVEFPDGSGIGTTYSVDKPAPIGSGNFGVDVNNAATSYLQERGTPPLGSMTNYKFNDEINLAFNAGADWQRQRLQIPDQPEIGAPIAEMPLTGLVLDKLNQVIEMLQRQNNRMESHEGRVMNSFAVIDEQTGRIIEHQMKIFELIGGNHSVAKSVSDNVAEILGLMRPERVDKDRSPWDYFFSNITALVEAADIDLKFVLSPATKRDYDNWLIDQAGKKDPRSHLDDFSDMPNKQPEPAADESGQGAGFIPTDDVVKDVILEQRREIHKTCEHLKVTEAELETARLEIKRMYDREDKIAGKFKELHDGLVFGRPV